MLEFGAKEEYIKKIEKELEMLRRNIYNLKSWKIEKEVLEKKLSAYGYASYTCGGSPKTFTLDDIVDKDITRLNTLDSNIDYTEYKIKEYYVYLNILDDLEVEIIKERYLKPNKKAISYDILGKKLKCSHTTAKRWHDSAIEKIANYKHQSVGIA